jgi:DUF2075 family protein
MMDEVQKLSNSDTAIYTPKITKTHTLTLKMEATCTSKTLATSSKNHMVYQTKNKTSISNDYNKNQRENEYQIYCRNTMFPR